MVAPQSGAKQNFFCTLYSNGEVQRASKNLNKIVEAKINTQVI
jgi:hypothetical protein